MPEILESTAAATPATSTTFTVSSPTSIQALGLADTDFLVLEWQYEGAGWQPARGVGKQGRIQGSEIPRLLVAPGTYRIQKPATTNDVSIAYVS